MNDDIRIVRELYGEVPPAPHLRARIQNRLADAETARGARALRFPRPALLLAGVTAVGVLSVGAVVALSGADGAGPVTTVAPEAPADARSFLLASAQKAERAQATVGRYWYTRERTVQGAGPVAGKDGAKRVPAGTRVGDRKRRIAEPSFSATVAHTQESWTARDAGDRTRTIVGIDRKYTFASPADEAKWKAMGSPSLGWVPAKPHVNNYDEPMRFMIGQKQVGMRELAKLPTDATGLNAELRKRYKADTGDPKFPLQGSYASYVWSTAQDLLAGPITPGTKAALYRVLAEQEGIRLIGKVTDPLGRPGVALSRAQGSDKRSMDAKGRPGEARLIIDPATGRLLAYQAFGVDDRGRSGVQLSMAYEAMGWVNSLSARP